MRFNINDGKARLLVAVVDVFTAVPRVLVRSKSKLLAKKERPARHRTEESVKKTVGVGPLDSEVSTVGRK